MDWQEFLKIAVSVLFGAWVSRMFMGSDKQQTHEVRIAVLEQNYINAMRSQTTIENSVNAMWKRMDGKTSRSE